MVELALVFGAAFKGIDAGGVDACVAEKVGEAQEVFFGGVEGAGKEVAQVVGEDFPGVDASGLAEGFHGAPDVGAVEWAAGSRGKDGAGGLFLLSEVAFEEGAEPVGQEDEAVFAFVVHIGAAGFNGFGGDEGEFTDADAGGGEGLQDEGEAVVAVFFCGADEADVFVAGEFFVFVGEEGALDAKGFEEEIGAVVEFEVAVQGGEDGVDGSGGVVLGEVGFPFEEEGFVDGAVLGEVLEAAQGAGVLAEGGGGALLGAEVGEVGGDGWGGKEVGHRKSPFRVVFSLLYQAGDGWMRNSQFGAGRTGCFGVVKGIKKQRRCASAFECLESRRIRKCPVPSLR